MTITTSQDCMDCKYGFLYGTKKDMRVRCEIRDKSYYYGYRLECDFFTKKEEDTNE